MMEVWQFVKENPVVATAVATIGVLIIEFLRFLGIHRAIQAFVISIATFAMSRSEEKSTELDVSYRELSGSSNRIVVENAPGSAASATINRIDVQEGEPSPFAGGELDRKLPAVLEPGQSVKFIAAANSHSSPPHNLEIDWTEWDESGEEERTLRKTVYR